MIIYNSAVDTHILYDFGRGWDKKLVIGMGRGDGTIPAQGIEWACDNWDHTRNPLVCFDLNNEVRAPAPHHRSIHPRAPVQRNSPK
jgi:hypothetical protein